jgi:hypothetical protein
MFPASIRDSATFARLRPLISGAVIVRAIASARACWPNLSHFLCDRVQGMISERAEISNGKSQRLSPPVLTDLGQSTRNVVQGPWLFIPPGTGHGLGKRLRLTYGFYG